MGFWLYALLLTLLANSVYFTCQPISFTPSPNLPAYGISYAVSQLNDYNGDECDIGKQEIILSTEVGFVILFEFTELINLVEGNANVTIFDYQDLTVPLCIIKSDDREQNCTVSFTNKVLFIYQIDHNATDIDNLPLFEVSANSIPSTNVLVTTTSNNFQTTPSACEDILTGSPSCSDLSDLCLDGVFKPLMAKECAKVKFKMLSHIN
uniref:DUF4773 domain-containing protein n=1 Tax=Rhabditophanes sp. KR3021 TaxID=114890 RepID=A0AC35UFG3_9BILA